MKYKINAAIVPPTQICAYAEEMKNQLREIAGNYSAQTSLPNIPLFSCDCNEEQIQVITKKIEIVCHSTESFKIELKDFDVFYNNRTIFIAMSKESEKNISLLRRRLSKEIKQALPELSLDINFEIGRTGHITIARKLTDEQYQKAKKYFTNKKYASQFICDSVVLRRLHVGEKSTHYKIIHTFQFANPTLTLFA